jgi:hypothetical protein
MKRHTKLFEDFSYLQEELQVIDLFEEGERSTTFVFRDKNEAQQKLDELNENNPNLDRARITQTIDFMERKVASYFDEGPIEVSDIEDLYDSLNRQERRVIDEMAFNEARRIGRTLIEQGHKHGLPRYEPIYYTFRRREKTLGGMLEEFRETLDLLGLDETIKRFGNRVDWIPANVLRSMHKGSKTKNLFGL